MRGIDFSFAKIDPAAIRAAGYTFVMRYVGDTDKCITKAEYEALKDARLGVGLVFEAGANDALDGAETGRAHAVKANAAADVIGFPRDRPLYYACDFDDREDPNTFGKLGDYFGGVGAVGVREHGIYGSDRVCDWFAVRGGKWAWQTVGWSKGLVSVHALLLQEVTHAEPIAGAGLNEYDDNLALRADFGQDNYQPQLPTQPKVRPVIATSSPLVDVKQFHHGVLGHSVAVALTKDGGTFSPAPGVGFSPFSPVGQAYWKGEVAAALAVAGDPDHPLTAAEAKAKCAYVIVAESGHRFAFGQGKG